MQYDRNVDYDESEFRPMNKEKRLQLISKIISKQEVKTQEELQQLLYENGLPVTQATISRDIHTLKLFKVQSKDGNLKYANMVDQEHLFSEKLRHKFRDALVGMEIIDKFLLVKTLPGNAHAFGVLLDSIELEGKAGTICGNDTCLVICRSEVYANEVWKQLDSFNN